MAQGAPDGQTATEEESIMNAFTAAKIFGRANEDGTVSLFHNPDGEVVTRLDADDGFPTGIWPVGSEFGAGHEHPDGITLAATDAKRLGVEIEFPGHRVETVTVNCRITVAVIP